MDARSAELAEPSGDGRAWLYGIAAAVAGFAAAEAVGLALESWLGADGFFLLFVLPVLACALFFGRASAVVAALLALGVAMARFFSDRHFSAVEAVQLATFAFVSLGIVLLAGRVVRVGLSSRRHRIEAEAEARRSQTYAEELNLLIEGATDTAIYMVDPEGLVTIWNKGAERLFGWREEEVIGQSCSLFYPPEEKGRALSDLERALAVGQFRENVWKVQKNGSEFLAEVATTPLRDSAGALRGFAKVLRDVSDRHAAEQAAERRERLMAAILQTVPDGMIVIDESGRITSFSTAASKIFGYVEAQVLGRNVSMLMPSPDRDRHDAYLDHYLKTGERRVIGIGRVVTGLRSDGSTFPMELSVGEATSEGQRLFTGFIRDLTEQHHAEARIQSLQTELIHVSRLTAMGTMASTLAHELNQPLTAIANYGEAAAPIIASDDPEDKALLREVFDEMAAQAIRAGGIVRRLREFISRGDVEKRVEDLPRLIDEAVGLALVGAREKGVSSRLILDPAATPVLVDRVQIQQVLINLIRNAVEAMAEGPVRQLVIETAVEDAETARVSVTDTGPGISEAVADQLFETFVSTKDSGMGLGLSICRTIVEAHGGRIRAEPAKGGGTRFSFTLPLARGIE